MNAVAKQQFHPLPEIVCRQCGNKHNSPVVCPYCQQQTAHYAVLKGNAK